MAVPGNSSPVYFVSWAPLKNVHGGNPPPATSTPGQTKFYVADGGTSTGGDTTYRYLANGNTSGAFGLDTSVPSPRGIAVNAAGTTAWLVDGSNQEVDVQGTDGALLGSFRAFGLVNPQGIATNGTDLWIVDAGIHSVLRFVGGAAIRAGAATPLPQPASSSALPSGSFHLDQSDPNPLNENNSPTDIVTRDGSTFWVTDDKAHAVFVYNASGNKVGEWFLDPADTSPSGITLNPNGGTDLWVVDRATHRVYDYAGATGWTSGNHSATSSFALASADGDPEGIADPNPPTVAIISPADNGQATAGSTVLVTGQVTASTPGTPVVAANGTPVDAVDAANNFFNRQSVALGPNASTYTAIDASGQASSPVTLHETGTNPPAGPIDFASLSDVTASFSPQYGRTSYNSATTVLYADMAAQDVGTYTVHTPLLVAVKHISNPLVRVRDYDGVLPDGTYYYDFSKLVAGRTIEPGQTTNNGVLAFFDPQQVPFTYDLVFLAPVNRPPSFTSVPVVETAA
ncbi:hypothetical protein SAMN05444166_7349, partial [Singulisphaera sp. GP187]